MHRRRRLTKLEEEGREGGLLSGESDRWTDIEEGRKEGDGSEWSSGAVDRIRERLAD